MHNLIIIDEDSRINGIGTYLRGIIRIFKSLNAKIYRINHSNESKDTFTAKEDDGIITFSFSHRLRESYNKIIDKFLGLYIEDSEQNLFMLNYTPCEDLILTIKNRFPKSKITFTIHDMSWTYHFLGDTEKLKAFQPESDSEHDTEAEKNVRKNFREEQRMFSLVDRIIVLAQETIHVLKDIYKVDAGKICFIPNGTEDIYQPVSAEEKANIRKKKYLGENEKIILIVGRGHYIKGLYALLRCMDSVLQSVPDCRLVIIGSIINPITTFRFAKALAAKVVFTGQLTSEELKEWYRIADVGVLASYVEQCSYTGIEMMMYGIPVIASDGFCVGDMFKDGLNAKVAKIGERKNPEEPEEFDKNLADALKEILSSETKRMQLGKNGRDRYLDCYQFCKMQTGYQELVKSLF